MRGRAIAAVSLACGCGLAFDSGETGGGAGGTTNGSAMTTAGGAPGTGQAGGAGGVTSAGGMTSAGGAAGAGGTGPTMSALDGMRIELPCTGPLSGTPEGCVAGAVELSATVDGVADQIYSVTLRIRGVMEQNAYIGGAQQGSFYEGGTADNAGWNDHRISVSDPANHYFVNAGTTGILECAVFDYPVTIAIAGGATVTLQADAKDGAQVRNRDASDVPHTVNGITTNPHPYDGQFFQLDVIAVD